MGKDFLKVCFSLKVTLNIIRKCLVSPFQGAICLQLSKFILPIITHIFLFSFTTGSMTTVDYSYLFQDFKTGRVLRGIVLINLEMKVYLTYSKSLGNR